MAAALLPASPSYMGADEDALGGHTLLSSLRALRAGLGVAPDAGAEAALADELRVSVGHGVGWGRGRGGRGAGGRARLMLERPADR
jgi:hypothetical protein